MKNKNVYKRIIIYIFIIIFSITLSLTSGVIAKYVKNTESSIVITPNDFYFYTNYEDKESYNLYSLSIDINVKNYYLGNYTEEEINYVIKVNDVVKISSILEGNKNSENEHTLNFEYDQTYVVVVESISPFVKKIEHTFKVNNPYIDSYYSVTDKGGWVEVDLCIGTTLPDYIIINYNTSLAVDNTNQLIQNSSWDSYSVRISKSYITNNSNYNLVFFKNSNISYTNVYKATFVISGNTYSLTIN